MMANPHGCGFDGVKIIDAENSDSFSRARLCAAIILAAGAFSYSSASPGQFSKHTMLPRRSAAEIENHRSHGNQGHNFQMKTSKNELPGWFQYGLLIFAGAFLYQDLFILPATPIFDPNVDQILNLQNAMRMIDGQVIYRDFFQFTPPGTELIYFALFKLVGVHAWIPNAMMMVLGLSLTWVCIVISRKILSGAVVFLPALLFLLLALHPVLDANHSWYSILAVMVAMVLVVEERTTARIAGAAALFAVASFFTQTRGVVSGVGLAVFLLWEHRWKQQSVRQLLKFEGVLAGVFSVVTIVLNLYFIRSAGLKRYWWDTVTFVVKYYSADSPSNNFRAYMAFAPNVGHWYNPALLSWIFIYSLLPLVYVLFFVRYWRESTKRTEQPWARLMLVNLPGFSLFLGVAPAPAYWRLCAVAMPGMVILGWFLSSPGRVLSLTRQAIWAGTALLVVVGGIRHQTREWNDFNSPVGHVALFDADAYERFEWLRSHTHPGQFLFDSRGEAYFLFRLKCPSEIQFLTFTDYVRPEQVINIVESLESRQVPMVLWCPDFDAGAHGYQPGDHLGPIRAYLHSHYHQVKTFEPLVQVLERNGLPVSQPDGIR
jgi:hypothetical protein